MKKPVLLGILIATIVFFGAAVGFFIRYNNLGTTPPPRDTIVVFGETLEPKTVEWFFTVIRGRYYKHITYDLEYTPLEITGESETVSIDTDTAKATTVEVFKDGEKVFTGTRDDILSFKLPKQGEYEFLVICEGEDNTGYGNRVYTFRYIFVLPPKIIISDTEVVQGEAVSIYIENLPDSEVPILESQLGSTLFTYTDDRWNVIIPVGYLTKPGSYSVTLTVGNEIQHLTVTVSSKDFPVEYFDMDEDVADATVNSAAANAEYRNVIWPLYETKCDERYWEGNFIIPAIGRISSEFGLIRYINGSQSRHAGIDIAAPEGTHIVAPNNGMVEFAGFLQLSGNTIVIDHGGGLKSYFFHQSKLHTQTGDIVYKEQLIGEVGTTGYSTGNHLHYQLQIEKSAINPWQAFDGTSGIFLE